MTRTLAQINKQIEALEKEAQTIRANEVAGVVQKIKTAIDFYGLTVQDLFSTSNKSGAKVKAPANRSTKAKKSPAPAKYHDKSTGKTWNGHGKRPGWFVKAIESGAAPGDLAI